MLMMFIGKKDFFILLVAPQYHKYYSPASEYQLSDQTNLVDHILLADPFLQKKGLEFPLSLILQHSSGNNLLKPDRLSMKQINTFISEAEVL